VVTREREEREEACQTHSLSLVIVISVCKPRCPFALMAFITAFIAVAEAAVIWALVRLIPRRREGARGDEEVLRHAFPALGLPGSWFRCGRVGGKPRRGVAE